MGRFEEQEHWLMLAWLLVTGLVVFGVVVCLEEGLLQALAAGDRSRISLAIGLLYVLGTVHCARRAALLAGELDRVRALRQRLGDAPATVRIDGGGVSVNGVPVPQESILGEHLAQLARRGRESGEPPGDGERSTLVDLLVARTKGAHELGWFVVDILIKLGLIGTIVGFILMLSSVANTASLDVNTMQKVLKQMSAGMGTALFTTLAGLTGSILLGLQYLLLDKGADSLIENTLRMTGAQTSNR